MTQRRTNDPMRRQGPDSGHVNVTVENTGEGTVYRAEPRYAAQGTPVVERDYTETNVVDRTVAPQKDRIRWGPVLAGLIATIAAMTVLSVLGLALGLSAFDRGTDGDDVGTAAAIWTALSALLSFLLGGWVAGKTASVHGDDNALLNGAMVGATALSLILLLTGLGLGNLLGGIGSNIGDIARLGRDTVSGGDVNAATETARQTAAEAYDDARNAAWGTLAGMLLALGSAAVGGLLGHRSRREHREHVADGRY